MRGLAALLGAERTHLGKHHDRRLDLVAGALDVRVEGVVELPQDGHPRGLPFGDVVELLLQLRGEADVHDVAEVLHQVVRDHLADLLGEEALVVQAHVAAIEDRRDRRRVRGWAADAVFLERLDEARLAESRRGLREVLLGKELQQPQSLLGGERRERRLGVLVWRVVTALEIHAAEALEPEGLAGRAKQVPGGAVLRGRSRGGDVHRDLVEPGLSHLRGHGPLPDQPVEASLARVQHRLELVRMTARARRTDRLVRLLSAALLLPVSAGFGQRILGTVKLLYDIGELADGLVRDVH